MRVELGSSEPLQRWQWAKYSHSLQRQLGLGKNFCASMAETTSRMSRAAQARSSTLRAPRALFLGDSPAPPVLGDPRGLNFLRVRGGVEDLEHFCIFRGGIREPFLLEPLDGGGDR